MSPSRLTVALASLAATFLFYVEYVLPGGHVNFPYDLAGYHYPLANYAFLSLKDGRFPLWDPTMYAGMPFIANVQTALFYPFTWLMFALNWNQRQLPYLALERLDVLHVWLSFLFCYLWLKGRRLEPLASLLGSAVFAYGGYLCTQMQHFGLVAGYAWFPFGMWGIDQAIERGRASQPRRWLPLWKWVVASAMCFLAGYPPTWAVLAMAALIYAFAEARGRRWTTTGMVLAGLLVSLGICAIQILPAMEISEFREPELRYGAGIKELAYFFSTVMPNYYDFGLDKPVDMNPGREYLYLGAPGIAGVLLLILSLVRRRPSGSPSVLGGIAVLVASLIMATNPYGMVWAVIQHSALLGDVLRSTYFLAGAWLGIALLSAIGLDGFIKADAGLAAPNVNPSRWRRQVTVAVVAMGLWALIEIFRWPNDFAVVGWSGLDAAITLGLLFLGLSLYRRELHARSVTGRAVWIGLAVLTLVGFDYKVFGTSKRFNADAGSSPEIVFYDPPAGFDVGGWSALRSATGYRVLLDNTAPFPTSLRHLRLNAPQGFDPFFSTQFREFVGPRSESDGDRNFWMDPADTEAMHLLGIRYIISSEQGRAYETLRTDPRFRPVNTEESYYRVFEYLDAVPQWQWLAREPTDRVELQSWSPERRTFAVHTARGGRLTMSEQWFPGWEVSIDGGEPLPVDRYKETFQSVQIPSGEHAVTFAYHSTFLFPGALISLGSLVALAWWMRKQN